MFLGKIRLFLTKKPSKAEGGRGLGLALRGGIVYLSYGGRLSDGEKRGCVVALDFETGEVVQTFRGFAKPTGLCVANDQLLVSDRGANEVRIMTLEGEDVHTIGQGQLKYPNDVAVDSCGNILVMDTGNERVAVFLLVGNSWPACCRAPSKIGATPTATSR